MTYSLNRSCLVIMYFHSAFTMSIHFWETGFCPLLNSEIVRCSFGYRYGFRSPPHLELKARPKLGEREVTFAHVTDWIEKKLDQEFQVQPGSTHFTFLGMADQSFILLLWQSGLSGSCTSFSCNCFKCDFLEGNYIIGWIKCLA